MMPSFAACAEGSGSKRSFLPDAAILQGVGSSVFVVIQPVISGFCVVAKAQGSRIPRHRAAQFGGDVAQTAERAGAAAHFNRSDGIFP